MYSSEEVIKFNLLDLNTQEGYFVIYDTYTTKAILHLNNTLLLEKYKFF